LSKNTSTIAPKIGIIAAHIVGVTGSESFCPINKNMAPIPHPKNPIDKARNNGKFLNAFAPSMKNQNGNKIIAVMKNLKKTKVNEPQLSNNTSTAGKPIAHKNIAKKHAKLFRKIRFFISFSKF
jgi:hypothetical protein